MLSPRFLATWVIPLAFVLAHCGDGPGADCPEGQMPDGQGDCMEVCTGTDCNDGGVEDSGTPDGEVPECEDASDCDDFSECTTDSCDAGMCMHADASGGTPCDLGGSQGICVSGECEEDELCRNVNCNDGIDCTDDSCLEGVCTNTPNNINCNDGNACSTDTCNAVTGCEYEAKPDFETCDDGNASTGPDICRNDICVGAERGEIDIAGEAVDLAKAGDNFIALINEDNDVAVFSIQSPTANQSLGSTKGRGYRLHTLGNNAYVAGEFRNEQTCGEFSTCGLFGISEAGGQVVWSGTLLHTRLSNQLMGPIHDINTWVDDELGACGNSTCTGGPDVWWWFVGSATVQQRPKAVYCRQASAATIVCATVSSGFESSNAFDGMFFSGKEVAASTSSVIAGTDEYKAGLFGLNQGSDSTVIRDLDGDPDNALSTGGGVGDRDVLLRGSFQRSCNRVVQYGDRGSLICSATNTARFGLGCNPDTDWVCTDLIRGTNFVNGTNADRALLVTEAAVFVNTGSISSADGWTRIDFGLEPGVQLAAVAGDSTEWFALANDSNNGKVIVLHLPWSQP